MYQVIGTTRSRTLRVIWMLEELNLPYTHTPAAPQSDVAQKANPSGKVPILIDGNHTITDSVAIVTYLADRHGALTYPAGTIERAHQDSITHLILDEVDAALWSASRHSNYLPSSLHYADMRETVKWDLDRAEQRLIHQLGDHPFLMGEQITIPDILLTHCGGWPMTQKMPFRHTVLRNYFRRMRNRPAYQKMLGTLSSDA
ncbi:glutathione S-transferase family protein [Cochlodiniinecator piscidefendens]|uniref:glutathione S-transferase family protein n=1 Tax=Cochlodiniinecator piscidefendens TaxID=2715756 RepID=UPI00140B5F67|nr:glutathione S-transferase family protein [Cochlodiniinecator piscidefendens]